jgi:hypothetical protein
MCFESSGKDVPQISVGVESVNGLTAAVNARQKFYSGVYLARLVRR